MKRSEINAALREVDRTALPPFRSFTPEQWNNIWIIIPPYRLLRGGYPSAK